MASLDEYIAEARGLERQTVAMPLQIFSLARKFADHADQAQAQDLMVTILANSESAFVRRVAYTGVRYAGNYHATKLLLNEFLLKGLSDTEGWVVYDSVWLAQDLGANEQTVLTAILSVANGNHPSFVADDDSWARAQDRAHARHVN
jgi:hypothetical protein